MHLIQQKKQVKIFEFIILGCLLKSIESNGAIPFVKSNVPQLLLINESNNWIWGRSENPWNRARSTGGSSGGEAGLVTLGASPVGFGSDGGGSVRIPALNCGIYGLKPTGKRITKLGHKKPSQYAPRHIFGVNGTLARSVDDVSRGIKSVLNYDIIDEEDFLLPRVDWDQSQMDEICKDKNRKLKIGFYKTLNVREILF